MKNKPLCLDAFCSAGGCSRGYADAGFTVVGVDHKPQPNYPYDFVQADAIEYIREQGPLFDLIAASPPCQLFTPLKGLTTQDYLDLIEPTRAALKSTGKRCIIENVPGSPLKATIMLCGTMFGLRTIRHRLFECFPGIYWPPTPCQHIGRASAAGRGRKPGNEKGYIPGSLENFQYITVVGNDYIKSSGEIAMDIDWMTKPELSQAIPPAYTEFLGSRMLELMKWKF